MATFRRRARRPSTPRVLAAGALDGLLATLPMSALMLAAQRAGWIGRMPPRHVTEAALHAAGAHHVAPDAAKRAASFATHLAFGAAAGATYAWWARRDPRRRGVLPGIAYGTLVWLLSYAGWIPALGILPPPHVDRHGRPATMIAAHWVYGGVLGELVDRGAGLAGARA